MTRDDLADLYARTEIPKQRHGPERLATLEREVPPVWRNRRLADIKRRDVIALIEAKAQDGNRRYPGKPAPVAANRLFSLIRRMFNFAIRRDLIETTPCLQVQKPGEEHSKDRVLTRDELKALWRALEGGVYFTPQTAAGLKFVLATACRAGEACSLRWSDIDAETGIWTLPAAYSKIASSIAYR